MTSLNFHSPRYCQALVFLEIFLLHEYAHKKVGMFEMPIPPSHLPCRKCMGNICDLLLFQKSNKKTIQLGNRIYLEKFKLLFFTSVQYILFSLLFIVFWTMLVMFFSNIRRITFFFLFFLIFL